MATTSRTDGGQGKGPLRVVLTGATGMVGEGVLHECLKQSQVEQVLVIGRNPCGVSHPKLTEILAGNLYDLAAYEGQLQGYNACFYCLGTTSAGKNEAEYTRITYDLTVYIAGLLSRLNPGMTFCYVTATGTDREEKSLTMWARVKGKTENALLKLPFRGVYLFRPSFIRPMKGMRNTHSYYKWITWTYPFLRWVVPGHAIRLEEIGQAMLHVAAEGYPKDTLDSEDMAYAASDLKERKK